MLLKGVYMYIQSRWSTGFGNEINYCSEMGGTGEEVKYKKCMTNERGSGDCAVNGSRTVHGRCVY